MKNRFLIIAAALLLLVSSVITVIAVRNPDKSKGGYTRDIIDRVSFTVDHTKFMFTRSENAKEEYTLAFTLTAAKTEADFYAMIHSVEIEGLRYNNMIFQTAVGESYVPQDMILPAEKGKAMPVTWNVILSFSAPAKNTVDFSLKLDYTSGITPDTAEEHILNIPMQITMKG